MARLIDAEALKNCFCKGPTELIYTHVVLGMIDDAPTVDAKPVRRGRWDLCITAKNCDMWTADAVCRNCGFTKPAVWSGFFPAVPAGIARFTTRIYSERVKLPNYCEDCGAKMDRGET